jgi:RNA polymerase sigma factor (sigma-70 family)
MGYGYAMALTRNQAEAEDLVQETYVRAIRGADSLRAGSNVKNWLFTILRNILLNQLRQQRAAPKLIELDADEGKTDIAIETSPDRPSPVCTYSRCLALLYQGCSPKGDTALSSIDTVLAGRFRYSTKPSADLSAKTGSKFSSLSSISASETRQ